MENRISLKDWLVRASNGDFDSKDRKVQCEAGWYDWFCSDKSLANRLKKMMSRVRRIARSPKVNQEKTYVFFKNNCPLRGKLYDDFRICDRIDGGVIYTIIPHSGHDINFGTSEVWGRENEFEGPLVSGTWNDVLKFFGV